MTTDAADREYTANTRDETVWVRVAGSGQVLGVQLEPPVMDLRGDEIADRIQACADVAYLEGQVALRAEFERRGAPADAIVDGHARGPRPGPYPAQKPVGTFGMKVDAPGLIAAAQRLLAVVEALGGSGVPHAPLAADPASIGAATRLTTAGEELTAALTAHITALVETIEYLTGTVITFVETDANNAAAIATLNKGGAVAAGVGGSAPPAPPVAPDVRVPIGPPPPMPPEVISVAVHTGNSSGGEPFINAWSRVATATHDASQMIRDSVQQLPETLDGPVSTPAVSHHLLKFAKGLETYSQRAQTLVKQANDHADNQFQVRQAVPTPQQFTNAQQRVHAIAVANAASGGKHAPQLAQAVSDKTKLDTQAVTNYPPYHVRTVANTNGDDPGAAPTDQPAADPTDQDPTTPKTPAIRRPAAPTTRKALGQQTRPQIRCRRKAAVRRA